MRRRPPTGLPRGPQFDGLGQVASLDARGERRFAGLDSRPRPGAAPRFATAAEGRADPAPRFFSVALQLRVARRRPAKRLRRRVARVAAPALPPRWAIAPASSLALLGSELEPARRRRASARGADLETGAAGRAAQPRPPGPGVEAAPAGPAWRGGRRWRAVLARIGRGHAAGRVTKSGDRAARGSRGRSGELDLARAFRRLEPRRRRQRQGHALPSAAAARLLRRHPEARSPRSMATRPCRRSAGRRPARAANRFSTRRAPNFHEHIDRGGGGARRAGPAVQLCSRRAPPELGNCRG